MQELEDLKDFIEHINKTVNLSETLLQGLQSRVQKVGAIVKWREKQAEEARAQQDAMAKVLEVLLEKLLSRVNNN